MLTAEQNELLTRVGPGTPAGEMLRRYWHPIAVAQDLTPESPTRFVRILGEDLVLFLDRSGRVGLLADHCSHRSASLLYGRVEARGIACAYHGWLYDTAGNILETPPERNDAIMRSVKQTAYPVQKYTGLYWAYLGPEPVPVIPKYDVWARRDGRPRIVVEPRLDCNWFQAMENSVDSAHLQILHQEFIGRGRTPTNTTRGFTDDVESEEYSVYEYGVMKKRTLKNGTVEEHPLLFPNILRQGTGTQVRVPMDDEHTMVFRIHFEPTADGSDGDEGETAPTVYLASYKEPEEGLHPFTRYNQRIVNAQDHMAWETQGPIANRSVEHLSYSDRGIVLFRRLVQEQIGRVQHGMDPIAVMREEHEVIDTHLAGTLRILRANQQMERDGRYLVGGPTG